ncbi:MAG: hypothetical protein R3213_12765 [Flavobacteriaceae bacterium]|nr:hypothetical protein [Flavobacteriaceae bacterium]
MASKKWKPVSSHRPNRSELHLAVRNFLHNAFPADVVMEEVAIPGNLWLDFYLPDRKIAVEAHGRQHFEFVQHFHGNRMGFALSKHRDRVKSEWCADNQITLIEIRYDEPEENWIGKFY